MAEVKPPEKEMEQVKKAVEQTTQAPPPEAQELGRLINNLILAAQEGTYEYVTYDCPKKNECPIAEKIKELAKGLKELNDLMKKIGRRT